MTTDELIETLERLEKERLTKENGRFREVLAFIRRGIGRGKIDDAMILLPYAPDATEADVKPLSALIDAALQPQGDAKPWSS